MSPISEVGKKSEFFKYDGGKQDTVETDISCDDNDEDVESLSVCVL